PSHAAPALDGGPLKVANGIGRTEVCQSLAPRDSISSTAYAQDEPATPPLTAVFAAHPLKAARLRRAALRG
ncbi:hypothetical protein MYX64_11250, partial [Nitrospinae bacterium AH_259_B05_G02_I21]|nr:hypothetical protein [Nitrospinae bacterium AH_259_B05_G02_I21]